MTDELRDALNYAQLCGDPYARLIAVAYQKQCVPRLTINDPPTKEDGKYVRAWSVLNKMWVVITSEFAARRPEIFTLWLPETPAPEMEASHEQ